MQGTLRGLESAEQERGQSLDRMREDSALAVKEINARTYAEREFIARQRAWNEVMRSEVPDAIKAAMAAETERAKMLAETSRKVEDYARSVRDRAGMAGMTDYERGRQQILNSARDFREQNFSDAATPMAAAMNTAGSAATTFADVLTQATAKIGGTFGRLVPVSEWKNGLGPSANATAADPRGMSGYIRDRAGAYGIDPETALRVARSEGLGNFYGDNGTSFGSMQLHVGGGIGDEFRRDTGLDPSNPANERATIDYALKIAAQRGWGPWHGAAKVGIGEWDGIGTPGARRLTVSRSAVNDNGTRSKYEAAVQEDLKTYDKEQIDKRINSSNNSLREQNALLDAQQNALTADNATLSGVIESQKLLNYFTTQRIDIDEKLKKSILGVGEAEAARMRKEEEFQRQRKSYIENLDLARSTLSGSLGGGLKALAKGEDVGAALQQSMQSAMDRMIDMQANRLTESLLGATGSANGGLLGDLLGFGRQQQTAQMNVQAGVVTVNGGVGTGATGGGIGGLIGSLFSSSSSGSLPTMAQGGMGPDYMPGNANGTDFWRGGPTWVGERGPEIINLPRGSQVMSNSDSVAYAKSLAAAGRAGGSGGSGSHPPTQVSFINAPGGEAEVKETRRSDGGVSLEVTFKKMLKKAVAQGVIDREMGASYGALRQAKSR
ncbi:hypothetical protein [Methylosinus sporium]|uniref:hypothetical protein n=1 Tax=Methylosinus sporium TaxID=428 RepID=UPI001FCE41D5|nr:hypothetical protein [Methylosinus sporium]